METKIHTLQQRYEQCKLEYPKMRIRDHARHLGVSEAELVNLKAGDTATLLNGNFKELLEEMYTLGRVMGLTRNDHCVLERKGTYNKVSFKNHVGLALDPEIDLRLFMAEWKFGFAVDEQERFSFQFFDKSGEAVHKIYMTEQSDRSGYFRLKALYKDRNQHQELIIDPYKKTTQQKPDEHLNIDTFHADWLEMKDTHQFFHILRRHHLNRINALRLAPKGYAAEVPNDTVQQVLQGCVAKEVPIMIFVSNRGCIQIHSGPIQKLVQTGPWYNILDADINMHLRTEAITSSFIVRKPSDDGIVTSLELFDNEGRMIVQFFGSRKPGVRELNKWRFITEEFWSS